MQFFKIVYATLMTENKQQVVSEKSYLMVWGRVEKIPVLPPESPETIARGRFSYSPGAMWISVSLSRE
jgi:hypothetical protein